MIAAAAFHQRDAATADALALPADPNLAFEFGALSR